LLFGHANKLIFFLLPLSFSSLPLILSMAKSS